MIFILVHEHNPTRIVFECSEDDVAREAARNACALMLLRKTPHSVVEGDVVVLDSNANNEVMREHGKYKVVNEDGSEVDELYDSVRTSSFLWVEGSTWQYDNERATKIVKDGESREKFVVRCAKEILDTLPHDVVMSDGYYCKRGK